jgi:hypothetical protein
MEQNDRQERDVMEQMIISSYKLRLRIMGSLFLVGSLLYCAFGFIPRLFSVDNEAVARFTAPLQLTFLALFLIAIVAGVRCPVCDKWNPLGRQRGNCHCRQCGSRLREAKPLRWYEHDLFGRSHNRTA